MRSLLHRLTAGRARATIAALVVAIAVPLSPALAEISKREVPLETKEGSFAGTWYYVDPTFRIAIFIAPDKTGLLTMRYKLQSKRGVSFETDAGGFAKYLDEGVKVEFLFTGTPSADLSTIEGRSERTLTAKNERRVEAGNFRIYRTSQGRSFVIQYPEFETQITDLNGRTKTSTERDNLVIFRKASDIVIDFDEIPF